MGKFLVCFLSLFLSGCVVVKVYTGTPSDVYYQSSTTVSRLPKADTLKVMRNGTVYVTDTLGNEYMLNGNKVR